MELKKKILILISLSFFYVAQMEAQTSVELPASMGALGDSLTAGAFAAYNRTDGNNPIILSQILDMIAQVGFTQSLSSVEARDLSWSTGMGATTSHAQRLSALRSAQGLTFQSFNAAVSGNGAAGLAAQFQALSAWAQQNLGQAAPDYVTLEIGADDGCAKTNDAMTSVADYSAAVQTTLANILAANPKSHIMIGSIPNVEHLRDVAQNSAVSGIAPFDTTCQDMWNITKFCTNILQEDNADNRAVAMARFEAYMTELQNIATDLNTQYGADRVRYAPGIYNYDFTDMDISIECFHPNSVGQQILSDTTWESTWWN